MSNELFIQIPSKEHKHDLTLLYLSQTVDLNSISIEELALRYLETRQLLDKAFLENIKKRPLSKW